MNEKMHYAVRPDKGDTLLTERVNFKAARNQSWRRKIWKAGGIILDKTREV